MLREYEAINPFFPKQSVSSPATPLPFSPVHKPRNKQHRPHQNSNGGMSGPWKACHSSAFETHSESANQSHEHYTRRHGADHHLQQACRFVLTQECSPSYNCSAFPPLAESPSADLPPSKKLRASLFDAECQSSETAGSSGSSCLSLQGGEVHDLADDALDSDVRRNGTRSAEAATIQSRHGGSRLTHQCRRYSLIDLNRTSEEESDDEKARPCGVDDVMLGAQLLIGLLEAAAAQ
eukprot:TRINITY_DN4471_c0_g1_i2.p1 TRINITY_DN4471_c0_g1~~TRINITY_DN4471_c0_g1_i2.p1  ORF type:complete len:236 (-),score=5.40 TRINITY_DN4471_c0_g1_i2:189-896(-)